MDTKVNTKLGPNTPDTHLLVFLQTAVPTGLDKY